MKRPYARRLRWLVLLLGLLAAPARLLAHGFGVESVTLEELDAGRRYRLSYLASPEATEALGLPVLPARCHWEAAQKNPSASAGLIFLCDEAKPLTAEDTIILPWRRNGVLFTAHWRTGAKARQFFVSGSEGILVELGQLKASSGPFLGAAKRYTALGVEHMLTGIDHLFFVSGLLLLIRGVKRLVLAITAFTLAHSVTLALSVLGIARVSPSYVEAIIALSVVFLAVENVRALRGQGGWTERWPWLVSFGFGLFHGLGFAAALNALGLPDDEVPAALLFFNVGVELGQLAFVAVWLAVLFFVQRWIREWPRPLAFAPSYVLGIVATMWFFQRVTILFG
jgi:hypothetical protein